MTPIQKAAEMLLAWAVMCEDDLAHALRLGAAALRDSEWLPIEGAPKDEWVWAGKWWDRGRMIWACEKVHWQVDRTWHGWTHYRPLPSPPKEQSNG